MKNIRSILTAALTVLSLSGACTALAATNGVPVVVPHDRDDRDLYRDLRGVPQNIRQLIIGFDQIRDRYLRQQEILLIKLKNATTPEEREQIREQLQDNRQQFLQELQAFRHQLKDDLQALRGKIGQEEFLRILDAAHDAATEGGLHHHRGH